MKPQEKNKPSDKEPDKNELSLSEFFVRLNSIMHRLDPKKKKGE
jgi:hypothetical protein